MKRTVIYQNVPYRLSSDDPDLAWSNGGVCYRRDTTGWVRQDTPIKGRAVPALALILDRARRSIQGSQVS